MASLHKKDKPITDKRVGINRIRKKSNISKERMRMLRAERNLARFISEFRDSGGSPLQNPSFEIWNTGDSESYLVIILEAIKFQDNVVQRAWYLKSTHQKCCGLPRGSPSR